MKNHLLTIKAKCKGNDQCLFEGQDLFLQITITNQQPVAIGYPLAYRQKTGPTIRLVDERTKAEAYLKTNLADPDLRQNFTEIPPGESVVLEWVITSGEIEQFARPTVDISAEITLKAEIRVRGKLVDTTNTDTIRITSRGTVIKR
jgi:hypothetical protein